jgi:hypothetical protein
MEINSTNLVQQSPPVLLTVSQFCEKHSFVSQGGLRFQIFNASDNGLASIRAIVRMGRKVLIDEERYFQWVESLRRR